MPVNLYDDHKVYLRRPHGNCDLDILRASYTRRKANVTEALVLVQVMKTRPFLTERLLMGRKESNQTKTSNQNSWSSMFAKVPV